MWPDPADAPLYPHSARYDVSMSCQHVQYLLTEQQPVKTKTSSLTLQHPLLFLITQTQSCLWWDESVVFPAIPLKNSDFWHSHYNRFCNNTSIYYRTINSSSVVLEMYAAFLSTVFRCSSRTLSPVSRQSRTKSTSNLSSSLSHFLVFCCWAGLNLILLDWGSDYVSSPVTLFPKLIILLQLRN